MQKSLWFFAGLLAVVAVGAVWLGFGLLPESRTTIVVRGGFESTGRPEPAPDISFSDAVGNSLTFRDFRGKVLLVNLWATWCAPCVKEMPSLDRLERALGGDRFQVVALSVDREGLEKVQPFFAQLGIRDLGIFLDPPGQALRAFRALGLPTSYLIDADGRVLGSFAGAKEWDSDASIAELRRYIGD